MYLPDRIKSKCLMVVYVVNRLLRIKNRVLAFSTDLITNFK